MDFIDQQETTDIVTIIDNYANTFKNHLSPSEKQAWIDAQHNLFFGIAKQPVSRSGGVSYIQQPLSSGVADALLGQYMDRLKLVEIDCV